MNDSRTSLYFSNLKLQDDEESLRGLLPANIEPLSFVFLRNKTGQRTGCAIVNLKSAEEASKAYESFQKSGFTVKYAKESKKDSTNVYVTNIPKENFDEAKLRLIFEPYGEIVSVKLFKDEYTLNTGIGFVRFTTKECANCAISHVNSKNIRLDNFGPPLFCKLADLKEKKEENIQITKIGRRYLLETQPNKPPMLMVQANFCVQPVIPYTNNTALTRYQTALITVPQTTPANHESERTPCQDESIAYAQYSPHATQNLDLPSVDFQEP
ncbi:unnamed protein product [Hymenolepis diminuta]|uniref:RRM domain-containing protein n=1 Tax=Hymenolepis diminuta TaxID=6216 RepID=A0A564ZCL1_HYMDI|nr:unnamed protein product [Hymenolepis diminuta]